MGHPLRDGPPDAGALLDPHRGRRPQALDLGRLAEQRRAVRGQREQAVDRVADLGPVGAERVRHQLEGLLQLRVEVVGGERQLGRRELRLLDRRDLVGVVQDRAVRVGADLHVGAVLALVAERVHVADDRERDLARPLGELRDRPHRDHLVHRGGERDRRARHPRELRAPHAAGDHDGLGLDVAAGGAHPPDPALLDVHADHLDGRHHGERAELQRGLAHERARAQRVDHADRRATRRRRGSCPCPGTGRARRRGPGVTSSASMPHARADDIRRRSSSIRSSVRATS